MQLKNSNTSIYVKLLLEEIQKSIHNLNIYSYDLIFELS